MKENFDELMNWLKDRTVQDIYNVETTADWIDEQFFGEREKLLGYSKENICDILRYWLYVKNDVKLLPQFVEFKNRSEYDVGTLAKHIIDAQLSRVEEMKYINDEWNKADGKWKKFFGEQNQMAFLQSINAEIAIKSGQLKELTNTLTNEEIKTAENVPLDVLVVRHNEIYEKIRDSVYEKFSDANGYFDQQGNRSKYRLDFEIDYKTPLSAGGKTTKENLRLVYKPFKSLPPIVNSSTSNNTSSTTTNGGNIPNTNLTWQLDNAGTLNISGNGDMANYSDKNTAPWYDKRDLIRKVIIESGVTSIGAYAFNFCEYIETVTFPPNLYKIEDSAFKDCYNLKNINLPDGLKIIHKAAFDR